MKTLCLTWMDVTNELVSQGEVTCRAAAAQAFLSKLLLVIYVWGSLNHSLSLAGKDPLLLALV